MFSYFYFSPVFLRISGGQQTRVMGTRGKRCCRLCSTIQPECRSWGMFLRLSDGDALGFAGILMPKEALTYSTFHISCMHLGKNNERTKRRGEFPLVINVSMAEHRSAGVRAGWVYHSGCPHLLMEVAVLLHRLPPTSQPQAAMSSPVYSTPNMHVSKHSCE